MILRRSDTVQIQNYINKMQRDVDIILKDVIYLSHKMGGSLPYETAKCISVPERRLMYEFLLDASAR